MTLDDLLPDGIDRNSSSSRSSSSSSGKGGKNDEPEYHIKVIGPNDKAKYFDEERWEKVKKFITDHTKYTVNQVMNNLPAHKRYKIVHQAATTNPDSLDESFRTETTCYICGKDCGSSGVEIEGEDFCVHHTAAQIRSELDS